MNEKSQTYKQKERNINAKHVPPSLLNSPLHFFVTRNILFAQRPFDTTFQNLSSSWQKYGQEEEKKKPSRQTNKSTISHIASVNARVSRNKTMAAFKYNYIFSSYAFA